MSQPLPEWADACCSVCPAQLLGPGEFDVVERPFQGQGFRQDGVRIDTSTLVPTCVHPFRLGLPPGAYASAGVPLPGPASEECGPERTPIRGMGWPGVPRTIFTPTPDQLELPEAVQDLEAWMVAMLRTAEPTALDSALGQAEVTALERFSSADVLAALRRVLTVELSTLQTR
jgi:hypothetical protein